MSRGITDLLRESGRMLSAKDKLMEKIRLIDEETAKELLDEWDDILLQLELESDEEFLKDLEQARKGEDVINYGEMRRSLGFNREHRAYILNQGRNFSVFFHSQQSGISRKGVFQPLFLSTLSKYSLKNLPVWERSHWAICSGVPTATT